MSSKAPIYLKRRGKKEKLRDVLSSDMISPPLGDFRHTIHIGTGSGDGDLFGDLSFLQGKFHLLPGRSRPASVCVPLPSHHGSPLLKNALSLPSVGDMPNLAPPPKPPRLHLDGHPRTPSPPSWDASPEDSPNSMHQEPYLSHGGSLLSLHLDLGPSILDDVLQIMDKHRIGDINRVASTPFTPMDQFFTAIVPRS